MDTPFYTVDVFTDRAFGGNPLAVFPQADGLNDQQMQQIARELNLSETTFVFPADNPNHTCKLRIFTPGTELPFAGHPTLGTAHILVTTGIVTADGDTAKIIFEEGVGPVPVTVSTLGPDKTFAQLTAAQLPSFAADTPSRQDIAAMLTINEDDVSTQEPIAIASCGVPYLLAPLTGLEAMAKLCIDTQHYHRILTDCDAHAILAWTRTTSANDIDIHARMFAPAVGIIEDPATGSAAAALAGYLAKQSDQENGTLRWQIEQGVEMQRPSLLAIEADLHENMIGAIRVGGRSISISEGKMTVPATGS